MSIFAQGAIQKRFGKAQALSEFEQTPKLAPDDLTANYNTGIIRARQGLFVEAISAFERAQKSAPNDASVLYELAGVQDRSGEPVKARKTLEAAHYLAPNNPMILLRLAELRMKAGSYPEAMSADDSLLDALRQSAMSKNEEKAIAADSCRTFKFPPCLRRFSQ